MAAAISRENFKTAAFNQRERDYLKQHPNMMSLSGLYLDRYIDKIRDEYQPFGVVSMTSMRCRSRIC